MFYFVKIVTVNTESLTDLGKGHSTALLIVSDVKNAHFLPFIRDWSLAKANKQHLKISIFFYVNYKYVDYILLQYLI